MIDLLLKEVALKRHMFAMPPPLPGENFWLRWSASGAAQLLFAGFMLHLGSGKLELSVSFYDLEETGVSIFHETRVHKFHTEQSSLSRRTSPT